MKGKGTFGWPPAWNPFPDKTLMEIPWRFPREADAIAEQAAAYRRLTPDERVVALLDLIASGFAFLAQSPHRGATLRLQQAHEAEWQRIHKELFARHGLRSSDLGPEPSERTAPARADPGTT